MTGATDSPAASSLSALLTEAIRSSGKGLEALLACIAEHLAATCAFIGLLDSGTGPATIAWAAGDPAMESVWAPVFAHTLPFETGGFGSVFFEEEPLELPAGAWPTPGAPCTRALLLPVGLSEGAPGVLVILRCSESPDFTPEAIRAAKALAILACREWRLEARRDSESLELRSLELLMTAFRLFGSVGWEAALQTLAVHARQALGARQITIFTRDERDRLNGVAVAGLVDHGGQGSALEGWREFEALAHPLVSGNAFEKDTVPPGALPDSHPWFDALDGGGTLRVEPLRGPSAPGGVLAIKWAASRPLSTAERILCQQLAQIVALLTSRARMQQQAAQSQANERMAHELARQRHDLIRQIVHDLRNTAHAMGLIAEEIDLAAGDVNRVRTATGALDQTVAFVSAYLKDKVRSLEDQHTPGDGSEAALAPAFERMITKFGPELRARGRRLKVQPCGTIALRLAPAQLDQILTLLVSESARFARERGVLELWASATRGWVTIFIQDDGPGLDPAAQVSLTPRHRQDSPAGRDLAILEALVSAAGGQFGILSRPGEWTRLHVGLPTTRWGHGDASGAP